MIDTAEQVEALNTDSSIPAGRAVSFTLYLKLFISPYR